jgi:NodT family efflux transporter outer membrane factor (OMF) lipoprotein
VFILESFDGRLRETFALATNMTVLYGQNMTLSRPLWLRALLPSLASVAALLTGCAPNLGPAPKLSRIQDYAAAKSFEAPAADWPGGDWWTAYGDSQLDGLIAEALRGAPDLRIAEARVREAQAAGEQAGAYRLPQGSASGAANEARIGQSLDLPPEVSGFLPSGFHILGQASANITYELDFFGKNRALLAAATSEADAARADRAAARLELAIAVADAYADFVRFSQDRAVAIQAVRVRRDTLELIANRQRNGLETRGVFSQQNATVADAQAQVEALDLQVLQARHRVAALLGEGPDRGLKLQAPQRDTLLHPYGLPPTLAFNLIGRRPDIVAARLRAEAERRRIKAARADFYPNIDLAASAEVISLNDQNIFQHNLNIEQIGPAISLPIFSGGRLEGAYRGARARYDEAAASYDKVLANALKEVADAIAGERSLQGQLTDARAALAADTDAYNVAKLRYQGGLSPYLDVLTAENAVLQQRQTVTNLSAESLSYDLALVHALGGGFTEADVRGPKPRAAAFNGRKDGVNNYSPNQRKPAGPSHG